MLLPRAPERNDEGAYDSSFTFTGARRLRRSFVEVAHGMVLWASTSDVGALVRARVPAANAFPDLLANITRGLARYSHNPLAHIRTWLVSSFSAGYGACAGDLGAYGGAIEAVVLLDSLHSEYVPRKVRAPTLRIGKCGARPLRRSSSLPASGRAAKSRCTFRHSQWRRPSYASTAKSRNT